MSHLRLAVDRVLVAATDPLPSHVSGLDKVDNDALRRPLRNPDVLGDVAKARITVSRNAEKHLRVIGDEPPRLCIRP